MMMNPAAHALVVERLCRRFPTVPEGEVVALVQVIETSFVNARIHDFIPLLVEREARDVLAHAVSATAPCLQAG